MSSSCSCESRSSRVSESSAGYLIAWRRRAPVLFMVVCCGERCELFGRELRMKHEMTMKAPRRGSPELNPLVE